MDDLYTARRKTMWWLKVAGVLLAIAFLLHAVIIGMWVCHAAGC